MGNPPCLEMFLLEGTWSYLYIYYCITYIFTVLMYDTSVSMHRCVYIHIYMECFVGYDIFSLKPIQGTHAHSEKSRALLRFPDWYVKQKWQRQTWPLDFKHSQLAQPQQCLCSKWFCLVAPSDAQTVWCGMVFRDSVGDQCGYSKRWLQEITSSTAWQGRRKYFR